MKRFKARKSTVDGITAMLLEPDEGGAWVRYEDVLRESCEGELAFRAGYGHGMNDAKHNYPPRPKGAYNEWRKAPVSEEQCRHVFGWNDKREFVCGICGEPE